VIRGFAVIVTTASHGCLMTAGSLGYEDATFSLLLLLTMMMMMMTISH